MIDQYLLAKAFELVPSHHDMSLSLAELGEKLSLNEEVPIDIAMSLIQSAVVYLRLFDLLEETDSKIRIKSQIPNYFLKSLVWYLKNDQKILSNWERKGTSGEVPYLTLLDQAPHFLKLLEIKRHDISKREKLPLEATRTQPCSIILIKTTIGKESYFLHQWDQEARRYQPIGGKQRAQESSFDTAKREFLEEIANEDLVYDRDYEIRSCLNELIIDYEISRTYGAMTRYELAIYQAFNFSKPLLLSESDKWISLPEMRSQKTVSGRDITPLAILLSKCRENFLENLPNSIQSSNKKQLLKYIELKPGIPGLRFDIMKWWNDKKSSNN